MNADEVHQASTSYKTPNTALENIDLFKVISKEILSVMALITHKLFFVVILPICLKAGSIVPVFKKGGHT